MHVVAVYLDALASSASHLNIDGSAQQVHVAVGLETLGGVIVSARGSLCRAGVVDGDRAAIGGDGGGRDALTSRTARVNLEDTVVHHEVDCLDAAAVAGIAVDDLHSTTRSESDVAAIDGNGGLTLDALTHRTTVGNSDSTSIDGDISVGLDASSVIACASVLADVACASILRGNIADRESASAA